MRRTSRARTSALGALLLTGILALTACSGPAEGPADAGSSAPAAAASDLVPGGEGQTTYPLELETPWCTTELTQQPQRIAALTPSQDDVEILAALGGTPIIASEYTTDAWIEDALSAPIPNRFTTGDSQYPVEQIAKAEPDLIIGLGADIADVYDKLSSIAPVLSTAEQGGSEAKVANDWAANIERIGEVLDLQDAAAGVLEDDEQFFADFREEHPELDGLTASYVVYYGEEGGLRRVPLSRDAGRTGIGIAIHEHGRVREELRQEVEHPEVLQWGAEPADVAVLALALAHRTDAEASELLAEIATCTRRALVIESSKPDALGRDAEEREVVAYSMTGAPFRTSDALTALAADAGWVRDEVIPLGWGVEVTVLVRR